MAERRPHYGFDPSLWEKTDPLLVRELLSGPVGDSIALLLEHAETIEQALLRARNIRGKHPYGGEQWNKWQAAVSLLEHTVEGEK